MPLSPFTNYTIRRMLQEHVESLSEFQSRSIHVPESLSLDRLITCLYPKKFVAVSKCHHLEMLTDLYRQASDDRNSLRAKNELKRRIFQVLGIRFGVDEVIMPSIVPEEEGTTFIFFGQGEVRDAIRLGHRIYGKVQSATLRQRPHLYQIALALVEQKIPCVITTSEENYSLWVLLRSPAYSVFLKQGLLPMQKVLVLHSALCRFKQARFTVQ